MRLLALAILAAVLVPSAAASTHVRAVLRTSSATPVVDEPWRYTVTVRSAAGKPLPARMRLQILVGTTVVGCWKGGEMAQCLDGSLGSWIVFKAKRTGVLTWPAQSVGVKLTFRAIVVAQKRTFRLRAPVVVQPKS
ncbi:MAG TPA: hypothetical protein VLA69_00650 [Gaiellaceae bacterium]|nr:hypothetical protein [Gaiellaceae bacterium]